MELDPLRRQIYAFVFSKDNPKKRKMSIVIGIDGFRSVADRTGNYRPDEDSETFETDESLRGPLNPLGLVSATVKVWKYAHGDWHKVTGTVYWDEIAPIKDEWAWDDASGKKKPTGRKMLDDSGQWVKMPRRMLAKCAEAHALRKGWPDHFSNVYESAELDRAKVIDLLPSEAAEQGEIIERQEKIGHKDSVPLTFDKLGKIEMVPVGQVADRCFAHLKTLEGESAAVRLWADRNLDGLREFWTKAPNDALAVKAEIAKLEGSK
jgi:phage recombination protein Bet